ncbi:MAG TPA: 16S rRNA processing protein RimM [Clostridiaceae bacterium]|nr:16S rRNA processing protein RimM [Clostridiaceae bacterium]
MQYYLEIGKIINTHGVKGEVKVIPLTDDSRRFLALKWAYVGKDNSNLRKYNIENVKLQSHKNMVIVKFKEVHNMSEAEQYLKGNFIKVDRENAVKLPEDTFFICDIIGCEVYDEDTDEKLGIVNEVIQTGSNDVYVVKNDDSDESKEILIPALKTVVKKVSLEESKIWVKLPSGLLD